MILVDERHGDLAAHAGQSILAKTAINFFMDGKFLPALALLPPSYALVDERPDDPRKRAAAPARDLTSEAAPRRLDPFEQDFLGVVRGNDLSSIEPAILLDSCLITRV